VFFAFTISLLIGLSSFVISNKSVKPLIKKKVDVTITSTNGTTFHIVGIVDFQLCCPAQINSFTGSIVITGGGHSSTYNFRQAVGTMDSEGVVGEIIYTDADPEAIDALNDPKVEEAIKGEITNLAQDSR
jgi:hypothetical protein